MMYGLLHARMRWRLSKWTPAGLEYLSRLRSSPYDWETQEEVDQEEDEA